MNGIYGANNIGPALAADHQDHRRIMVVEAAGVTVFHRVGHGGQVTQTDHGAIAVADDQIAVFLGGAQRIADAQPPAMGLLLDESQRIQGGALGDGVADFIQRDAVVQQRSGIQLHPHRRQRGPGDTDLPYPGNLRQLLRQDGGGRIIEGAGGEIGRAQRQRHDRRLGRVDLAVLGVAGHARRQLAAHRVDGRLHLPGRLVDVPVQLELQHDLGTALIAAGGDGHHA